MRSFYLVVSVTKKIKQDRMIESLNIFGDLWSENWMIKKGLTLEVGECFLQRKLHKDPNVREYRKNSYRSIMNLSFRGRWQNKACFHMSGLRMYHISIYMSCRRHLNYFIRSKFSEREDILEQIQWWAVTILELRVKSRLLLLIWVWRLMQILKKDLWRKKYRIF